MGEKWSLSLLVEVGTSLHIFLECAQYQQTQHSLIRIKRSSTKTHDIETAEVIFDVSVSDYDEETNL